MDIIQRIGAHLINFYFEEAVNRANSAIRIKFESGFASPKYRQRLRYHCPPSKMMILLPRHTGAQSPAKSLLSAFIRRRQTAWTKRADKVLVL